MYKNKNRSLKDFSLRGKSHVLEANMTKEVPILEPIALAGQCTAIFSQPNAGKTLLTMHLVRQAIKEGRVQGADVYYVNCDDSATGLYEKLKFAEAWGFEVLVPDYENFSVEKLKSVLESMCLEDKAKGAIVILDTLKKFTDVMDKAASTEFGNLCRRFSMKGGTLIALGHVKKYRDAKGEVVPTGTTDITDDFDCTYTLDISDASNGRVVATFKNKKRRGNVPDYAAFSYLNDPEITYIDRLNSVETTQPNVINKGRSDVDEKTVIDSIVRLISRGINARTTMKQRCAADTGVSQAKVSAIIEKYTGTDQNMHHWKFEVGAKGVNSFSLLKESTLVASILQEEDDLY